MGKLLNAVFKELLSEVMEMKDRAVKFRPTLERLETTLKSIGPVISHIEELSMKLGFPTEETEGIIKLMVSGKELVLMSSKVQWWNYYDKARFQKKLEELDESISRFFQQDMQAQNTRNVLKILDEFQKYVAEVSNNVPSDQRNELGGVCSPPEPPSFTVGFDVPLNELRLKLLRDQVSVSVLTVTGSGGSGKTTLAKMFCWDDQVKGKFNENIFFVTFAEKPKLKTLVQKLYKHNGYPVREFQSDEDAVNRLEHLLKQIGKTPMLLVLDDVWPGSESLIDNFVFQIPNYKILVTSRSKIRRFGDLHVLKPLGDKDAINLFRHSASLNQNSSDIPDNVVNEIVRGCGGSPLALTVTGRSLRQQPPMVWHDMAGELASGRSILDSSSDVHSCLQKSLDVLDSRAKECFRDLGLFPEDQRIPAAVLVDMWAELHHEEDARAMAKIYKLVNLNMADIVETWKVASGTVDYNYHHVMQHGLLRELAIRQTSQEPEDKRNRLIIDISGNNLPSWWTLEEKYPVAAHLLSISACLFPLCLCLLSHVMTDTSEWCNLQPTKVEVLVLNLQEKKCTLPTLIKKMNKLKVLIITNYDFYRADLENFELLDHLSHLKRIRFEKVSILLLSNIRVQLKNLQKLSLFMCDVNETFKNCSMPNLVEMNIAYSNMVEFPVELSIIVFLKKLSITNCHNLAALPEGIGNLVNLESLRLSSCTGLVELPDSVTNLHSLKFLDISFCINLTKLPENMGELGNLEKLNVRGCLKLSESQLPYSITELGSLRHVVCDEEMAALWEPYTTILSGLRLEVEQQADLDLGFHYHLL